MDDRIHTGGSSAGAEDDSNPACQSCRRRKLKCPREAPGCSQCIRLDVECVYISTRKPGMKSGAIEALNKRLKILEDIILRDDNRNRNQVQAGIGSFLPRPDNEDSLIQVSQVLIKELQKIGSSSSSECQTHGVQRKRRREDTDDGSELRNGFDLEDGSDLLTSLPVSGVLTLIVDKYFRILQHWIPFLHQKRFESQLNDPLKKQRNSVVLHAITSATLKFVSREDHGMTEIEVSDQVRHSRQIVMLNAMSRPSIVNLQALIIIAFDHIGSGEVDKAWSLIGSLTRTVEYLRLTVEPEALQRQPLRRPLTLLEPTNDWTEIEERRRLFWNIFLLDRYCSITTGWSTSLTSDDVHRKLPCDGGLWHREEASDTPYFGIWNKSAAKIGNSIAFIPAHYPTTPDHEIEPDNTCSPGTASNSAIVDTSKLGAFAYCIEATESLSQVTTFFLQQRIDFQNRREVGSWLTRFKELDLRLVHWKMFLPQQWKDSNISRDISFVDMDPNLTLAHLTHNTSMILLHQHIAYPPPHWNDIVKLPSSCSAETCQMAAIETSSICQKYLKYTENGIVNSQFALCAFVAGRILLVHWKFYDVPLSSELFSLISCLYEMSRRWQGHKASDQDNPIGSNIAAQYAIQLESFHTSFLNKPQFCMNVLGYSQDSSGRTVDTLLPCILSSSPTSPNSVRSPPFRNRAASFYDHNSAPTIQRSASQSNITQHTPGMSGPRYSTETSSQPNIARTPQRSIPDLTNHEWQNFHSSQRMGIGSNMQATHNNGQPNIDYDSVSVDDELTAMSNALLGQQFLEMDRVITYDGTNFAIDLDGWSGMN